MTQILNNKYVILVLRMAAGFYFIYAAQSKIAFPAEFAEAIRAYQIIPDALSSIPAIIFPWIELYCGLFLIFGLFTQSSATIAAGLLFIFTVNVLIALFRGLEIDCGCGVSLTGVERVSWIKVIENSVIILILVLISRTKTFLFSFDAKRTEKLTN